jgi:hypothetical protein
VAPLGADPGSSSGDPYAVGQRFAGLVVFAAVIALSRQHQRAFSPAMV